MSPFSLVSQGKLYKSVIDDVVNSMREAFADDGVDEQILMELKANWEKRLSESKAIETKEGPAGESHGSGNSSSTARGRGRNNNQAASSGSNLGYLPPANPIPVSMLQPSSTAASSSSGQRPSPTSVFQVDGPHDSSDEDEDDDDDDRKDDDDKDDGDDDERDEVDHESPGEDEDPLNTDDDVSDEEPNELFETDNVVVCQYDKVSV